MLSFIHEIQKEFMAGIDPRKSFPDLLEGLIQFTRSEYGFIGEIKEDAKSGEKYLKTYAITDISWNEETKKLYDENVESGLEFRDLDNLFGYCIRTGETVISNDPSQDERSKGIPKGHPSLNAFLGLPLVCDGRFIGMAGVANRKGGYDEALVQEIEPLTATIAGLMNSCQVTRQRDEKERTLSTILGAIIEGVCGIDLDGHVSFANSAAATMLGLDEDQLVGANFHELVLPTSPTGNPIEWKESALARTLNTATKVSEAFALFTTGTGARIEVEYTCVPMLKSGEINGGVVTFKDIGARRQNEREAQLARQKLAAATKDKERESRRLAMLVKNSPMCIHDIALDGTLISMNQAGLLIMGVTNEEEIIGLQYMDIPCKQDQERVGKLFEEAKKGDTAFFDFSAETDKGLQYFSSCFVPVEDESGQISSVMGITEDITIHKHALEEITKQQKRLRTIIDSVPVMIFSKDEKGRYTAANQTIADTWGMSVEEVLGKTTAEIHGASKKIADRSEEDDRMVLETGEEVSFMEEKFVGRDGEKKYLQITKRRAPEGVFNEPTIVGNAVDITALKKTEHSLQLALERAESANRAKLEFLSSVSHELRTPLNAVMGYAQLLQFDDLDQDQLESVNEIISASKKLTEKIDTLLYYGKERHGERGVPERINLLEFFQEQAKQFKLQLEEQNVDLRLSLTHEYYVNAVPVDMVELFNNLLGNAIKYNREDGWVEVTVREQEGNKANICVEDNGVGFSMDRATHIFEPFERLEQHGGTIGGTGLGLAIAKDAAERFGADIHYQSEKGKGSKFCVLVDVEKD